LHAILFINPALLFFFLFGHLVIHGISVTNVLSHVTGDDCDLLSCYADYDYSLDYGHSQGYDHFSIYYARDGP
jgi:hypothetical protein